MNFKKLTTFMLFIISTALLINHQTINAQENSLDNVSGKFGVFFCNNKDAPTKELTITTTPGQKNEICLYFINDSSYDLPIEAGLVNGKEVETSAGIRSLDCNLLTQPGNISKYIEQNRKSPVIVPANSRIIKYINVTFPVGIEGQIPVCLISSLSGNTKQAGNMFNFRFRTAYYLDFFVAGNFTGKNLVKIGNINNYLGENGNLIIDGTLINESALNNIVNISGSISNIFGYNKSFSINDIEIKAGTTKNFSTKELNLNTFLPRYKGIFKIKLNITYQPHFEFDTKDLNLNPELLSEKTNYTSTTYFEMPRLIFGILILIIILLILAFRKPKQKVVYVEKPVTK